ncbi:hypothetical protein YH66_06315 [[Brevibacterium] flavum]|uniref:Uncharacterized protein n=1 Tax=[Brevibacterium] flavum TaxID=92706 RepID=A0A0F6WQA8_9CORY|nr:hypothetical protein YH66_06315 [[Brevibacterium] flavum]ANE08018.1 hypothetical protein A3654_06315 [Corynebacterium glutamicum]AST20436.1 hypothetical protein CEY17_06385 [Corynebacterium glutamicum ATCC 14067]KEI22922.1 hypothetical protein KIQ_010165 [Corynebacterium glutamicum ATCC 14067]KIH73819.1 hypothetical protein SD36_06340 [Corynebacterium glutamicum]
MKSFSVKVCFVFNGTDTLASVQFVSLPLFVSILIKIDDVSTIFLKNLMWKLKSAGGGVNKIVCWAGEWAAVYRAFNRGFFE